LGEPSFPFVIRDPLLGDIALTPIERRVLDSDIFQRQRGIKQLGTSFLVYPSAVQSRFVHALGNLQVIGDMIEKAFRNADPDVVNAFLEAARPWLGMPLADRADVRKRITQVTRIAGMCHDLGHFPMSHVLEYAIKAAGIQREVLGPDWEPTSDLAPHEHATLALIRSNGAPGKAMFPDDDLRLGELVSDVIAQAHEKEEDRAGPAVVNALAALVSSEIDSDRAEYLRRDSYVSGARYGQYDIEKLTDSYLLVRDGQGFAFRPSARAVQAVESFLVDRVHAYQHLYYHRLGVVMDAIFSKALRMIFPKPSAGTGERTGETEAEAGVVDEERRKVFRTAVSSVTPSDLHYRNFASPYGYVDDAFIWQYLRRVLGALESLQPLRLEERELRRVYAYLRAMLRRQRLWVGLWKRAEDFAQVSDRVLAAFCKTIASAHRTPEPSPEDLRTSMAAELTKKGRHTPANPVTLSILNFIAHIYTNNIEHLGPVLEKLLVADPSLTDLKTDFFVETGAREFFRPLKNPREYKIVSDDGKSLIQLRTLAPASVQAIEALWYEGIQMRMYVVTERELPDNERARVRDAALRLLPEAIHNWYVERGLSFRFYPAAGASTS
jgi:HD superfamily phosphohydrolase